MSLRMPRNSKFRRRWLWAPEDPMSSFFNSHADQFLTGCPTRPTISAPRVKVQRDYGELDGPASMPGVTDAKAASFVSLPAAHST